LENFIQQSRWLCTLAGFVRGIIWYVTGKLNKSGAHLLVHATKTDQVLCVHPSSETYLKILRNIPVICHLPGGGIDAGESPEHAIVREVSEELCIENVNLSQAQSASIIVPFGRLRNQVTLYYLEVGEPDEFTFGSPRGGEFTLPHQWRNAEEAFRYGSIGMQVALKEFNVVSPPES
jgi:ADP-ribose pyrophosphatase YjhB (NUDIX family)